MRLIEANADFTRQFGRSHTELDGSRFCDLLHKDVQGKVSQQLTGESDLLAITRREAQEETGLPDLEPWPDAGIRHVVIVSVPAGKGEPAHEHADIRLFMATSTPAAARPENADAPLRWLSLPAAYDAASEPSV